MQPPNQFSQQMMSEINVTPLVDVMLILLIVFMVTTPLLLQEVRVSLPKTVKTTVVLVKQHSQISINASGQVFMDRQAVALQDLGSTLAKMHQHNPDLVIRLNADEKIEYGRVAQVMAIIQKAGISKLSFVTRDAS